MDKTLKKISLEWVKVGAPVTRSFCERKIDCVKETFTPSDHVLRSRPVTKLVEDQASDVKLELKILLVQWRSQVAMRQNKEEFRTLRHWSRPLVRCLHLLSRNNPTELIGICILISCHSPLMVVWVMIFQTLHSDIYNTHWERRIQQKLLEKGS